MKKKYGVSLLAGVFLLLQANVGLSAPVQWSTDVGGNGNWYEIVDAQMNWGEALGAAALRGATAYFPTVSHLATITSQAESDFITSTFSVERRPLWLGGLQSAGASSADSDWRWITGEDWNWTNWAPGEPNDYNGVEENALSFAFWNDSVAGNWNDSPATYLYGANAGYLVEYATNPVPVPASVLLLAGGLAGLIGVRRRKG